MIFPPSKHNEFSVAYCIKQTVVVSRRPLPCYIHQNTSRITNTHFKHLIQRIKHKKNNIKFSTKCWWSRHMGIFGEGDWLLPWARLIWKTERWRWWFIFDCNSLNPSHSPPQATLMQHHTLISSDLNWLMRSLTLAELAHAAYLLDSSYKTLLCYLKLFPDFCGSLRRGHVFFATGWSCFI